jgi:hypothetical protein
VRSNEALGIFSGSGSFLVTPKKSCGMSDLSKWKELGICNFAGSFVDSIQDLGILFSLIGQSVELEFPFFQEKSGIYYFP